MSKMSQLRQVETRRTIEELVVRPKRELKRAHKLAVARERAEREERRRIREAHRAAVAEEKRRRQEERAWRMHERSAA